MCSSAVHYSGFYDIFLAMPGRVKKQTWGLVMIDYKLLRIPMPLNNQPDWILTLEFVSAESKYLFISLHYTLRFYIICIPIALLGPHFHHHPYDLDHEREWRRKCGQTYRVRGHHREVGPQCSTAATFSATQARAKGVRLRRLMSLMVPTTTVVGTHHLTHRRRPSL